MSSPSESKSSEELVFVYGTLRKDGSNAWRMKEATFVTTALAPGHLYRVDWYPGATFDQTAAHSIVGEIYSLSSSHLAALDQFEGAEYQRINIMVTTNAGLQQVWAWEYQDPTSLLGKIPSGNWLDS